MEAKIIPFYAGILVFVYLFYSAIVINLRRTLRIGIGSGGKEDMQRAIRFMPTSMNTCLLLF